MDRRSHTNKSLRKCLGLLIWIGNRSSTSVVVLNAYLSHFRPQNPSHPGPLQCSTLLAPETAYQELAKIKIEFVSQILQFSNFQILHLY